MSSAVIGALRVNLSLDTAQFSEGLKGMRASLNQAGKQMQQIGGRLSTYVTAPLSIAGAAVTAAVTGIARDVEGLKRAAQVSNAGFEEFQRLAGAARTVGVESDKLADIYKDVNDRIGDFVQTGGGPMADFFENIAPQIGLTVDAFRDLSGPQALQLFYDSLEQANLSQQDMTFYLEAMASDTTALIPLLKDGGKAARDLGAGVAVLSEQDASGLERYNQSMRQFGESMRALTLALIDTGVLDVLSGLVRTLTDWATALSQTNPALIKWGAIVAGVLAAGGPVLLGLGFLATSLTLISTPVLAVAAGIAAVGGGLTILYQGAKLAWPYIKELGGAIWEKIKAAVEGTKQAFVSFRDAVVGIATNIVEAFRALPQQMGDIGRAIIDGLVKGISSGAVRVKDAIVGIASSAYQGVKDFFSIRSPSRLMADLGGYVVEGLGQGMESMSGQVEGIATNIASTVSQAFQGLIDGSKTVKDVIKDLLSQLSTMWINQGFQALLGGGMGGGGGGGIFGGLFSGIGKLFGGFFADGGRLGAGKWGIAGEFGPEIIKGPANVVPMNEMVKSGEGGGGKSVNIHQTFQLSGAVSSDDVQNMVRQGAGQAVQYVKESLPDWQFQQQTFGKIA